MCAETLSGNGFDDLESGWHGHQAGRDALGGTELDVESFVEEANGHAEYLQSGGAEPTADDVPESAAA